VCNPTCACQDKPPNEWQYRNVIVIGANEEIPETGASQNIGPFYPIPTQRQEVDTRIPGTTSPQGKSPWNFRTQGTSLIRLRSQIANTVCNMSPTTLVWEQHVNVVGCVPDWQLNGEGNIVRLPQGVPPTLVKIVRANSDPNHPLNVALRAAAAAWNTALKSRGLAPIFDETLQDASCVPSVQGGYCINVNIVAQVPTNPLACAASLPGGSGPDGIVANPSTIWYRSANPTDANWLKRLFAHELGHLLGLLDGNSCPLNESIMNTAGQFCSVEEQKALPTIPQLSDSLPVANTVYGPGSKSTCR
jgi:hypothetical protein